MDAEEVMSVIGRRRLVFAATAWLSGLTGWFFNTLYFDHAVPLPILLVAFGVLVPPAVLLIVAATKWATEHDSKNES